VAGLHGDVNLETLKAFDEYFQFPEESVSEHDGRVPKIEGSYVEEGLNRKMN
jgi:hypothetical protein